MRVAVIGSRGLSVPNLEDYLPPETSEIVSGGARGVDTSAREYALSKGMELIPCIQTLAHLNAIIRWPEYNSHVDYHHRECRYCFRLLGRSIERDAVCH